MDGENDPLVVLRALEVLICECDGLDVEACYAPSHNLAVFRAGLTCFRLAVVADAVTALVLEHRLTQSQ